jgi:maleylpyruvate isomerase
MKLTLHNYWRSSASYRVRIALGLKGVAFDYAAVHLVREGGQQNSDEYRKKNPLAQVPTLTITDDHGQVRLLTQSLPIIEFLDEVFPEPRLLPSDAYLRARCRALAEVINSGIQPLQNLTVTRKVAELGGDEKAWVVDFVSTGLAAFAELCRDISGRYCVGDQPTLADCCLVPQMFSARRFGVHTSRYPQLASIEEACNQLPAFASAHPDRQPDANP